MCCISDEETEDPSELVYLPISPDIDEPEDGSWAPGALPDQQPPVATETERKRTGQGRDAGQSPKKKKTKVMDIDLPDYGLEGSCE